MTTLTSSIFQAGQASIAGFYSKVPVAIMLLTTSYDPTIALLLIATWNVDDIVERAQ